MKIARHFYVFSFVFLFGSSATSFAQTPAPDGKSVGGAGVSVEKGIIPPAASPTATATPKVSFFKDIVRDQGRIWSSPVRFDKDDLKWAVPLAAATSLLIATDRRTSSWVSRRGSLPGISHDVSLVGSVYGTGGAVAGFYLFGRATHNRHAQETGRLSAESLIDTAIITQVLKFATGRKRPDFGTGQGHFFDHGRSFPSGHSSSIWGLATVVAYEYKDHPLIKFGAFALAAAVSLSRYTGRNHYLSDVLIGSSLGYAIGRYVYVSHH